MAYTAADILREYCAEIEAVAVDRVMRYMAPEIVFRTPAAPAPMPRELIGFDAVHSALGLAFTKMFKEFRWSKLEIHETDDPNVAVALASSRVKLVSGGDYSNDYMMLSRIKDGKIVEHYEFFDGARAAAATAGLF